MDRSPRFGAWIKELCFSVSYRMLDYFLKKKIKRSSNIRNFWKFTRRKCSKIRYPFIMAESMHSYFKQITANRESINPLASNDVYIRRTAQLTSRRCILNIYSTNILIEYFKLAAHSPFFFSFQSAVYFIMLPFLVL